MIDKKWEEAKELVRTNNLGTSWVTVMDVYRHLGGESKQLFVTDFETQIHYQILCPMSSDDSLAYDVHSETLIRVPNESVDTFKKYFKDNVTNKDKITLEIPRELREYISDDNFYLTSDTQDITL